MIDEFEGFQTSFVVKEVSRGQVCIQRAMQKIAGSQEWGWNGQMRKPNWRLPIYREPSLTMEDEVDNSARVIGNHLMASSQATLALVI